jgi:hypothetical protein
MVNFENCPVVITSDGTSQGIFANSLSISQNLATDNISSFGIYGTNGSYPTEPPNGNINADFYISGAQDLSYFLNFKKSGYADTLNNFIDVDAGPFRAEKAVLTEYSLSVAPNDVITASISLDYYGAFYSGAADAQQLITGRLGHGGFSTGHFASLGFNDKPFAYSYTLSQSFQPIRSLGEPFPKAAIWTDGTESLSIDGYDLPSSLTGTYSPTNTQWMFPQSGGVALDIRNICEQSYTTLGVTGLFASRNVSINADNVINGSIEIVKPL